MYRYVKNVMRRSVIEKMPKEEIDRKILKNAKDLEFHEAVYSAFPDAKRDEEFGVTACGEDLLVRRFN